MVIPIVLGIGAAAWLLQQLGENEDDLKSELDRLAGESEFLKAKFRMLETIVLEGEENLDEIEQHENDD